jgi:hypothetical protein
MPDIARPNLAAFLAQRMRPRTAISGGASIPAVTFCPHCSCALDASATRLVQAEFRRIRLQRWEQSGKHRGRHTGQHGPRHRVLRREDGAFDSRHVEARALRRGLQLARELGVDRILKEGDDLVLVQLLRGEEMQTRIPVAMQEIVSLLRSFRGRDVRHVYREGNSVAHTLCRQAYESAGIWAGAFVPSAVWEKIENGKAHSGPWVAAAGPRSGVQRRKGIQEAGTRGAATQRRLARNDAAQRPGAPVQQRSELRGQRQRTRRREQAIDPRVRQAMED